jgi:segregation and condensation protein B
MDNKLYSLHIEAILFFKNEPITVKELARFSGASENETRLIIKQLQEFYKNRGIVVVFDGERAGFGTHPEASTVIEALQREDHSEELSRASLETLSIILYKGPISRREIDYIRGVNSSYIIRNLLVRGLIERYESEEYQVGQGRLSGRGYNYKATVNLLRHLGLTKQEDLPDYKTAFAKINQFVETIGENSESANNS